MTGNRNWSRGAMACALLSLATFAGCGKPQEPANTDSGGAAPTSPGTKAPETSTKEPPTTPAETPTKAEGLKATADAKDVAAARARLDELGPRTEYAPKDGALLTEIAIRDGSKLKAEDLERFGKLSDLEKLQIFDFRTMNDEMAAKLSGLKNLKSLALTNSAIQNETVEMIVKSFPNLVELDLSSNTNMTNGVVKILSQLGKLQRLTLIQNRVNDIGAQQLSSLKELRAIDLRGNMEAGDMALEVVAALPALNSLKHRSTAVTDTGMEYLAASKSLESALLQDFAITDQSGQHLAKLGKLSQLEIFRCQGFGSDGVLALKGMGLTRLTLRDLPNVYDQAMDVFDDLPKLKRLYLHELGSVSDSGLSHLANLKTLELLDIWSVPQMSDATVEVIATLPNLKELSIRETGVTDASIDKLLAMPKLQTLTLKGNAGMTPEGLKKLSAKKWAKLDLGSSASTETE